MNTKSNSNSIQSSSGYTKTIHGHVFPFDSKKEDTNHRSPLPTTSTQHQPWSFFSERKHGGQGTVHPSIVVSQVNPTKMLRPAVFHRFFWGSICEDGTERPRTWSLGSALASSSQNVSKMSGTVFENSQDACQTWNMDKNGVMAPFQPSPCIFWLTILDISTNPPSQS